MSLKTREYGWPIIVLLLAVILVAFLAPYGLTGQAYFDLDLAAGDYGGVFAHLALVALIIERFVEVYNRIWRGPKRTEIENACRGASNQEERTKKEDELEAYKARTNVLTSYVALVLGLLVALAGVSTLGVLFDYSELPAFQTQIFRAVDIVITAGLLAGGSGGINLLTSLASKYGTVEKRRLDKKALLE